MEVYRVLCEKCSEKTLFTYTKLLAIATKMVHKDLQQPLANIYAFCRLADEIVDTFHEYDKAQLLQEFKEATFQAITSGISINPILHSFQLTVNEYCISTDDINDFLHSMEMDLHKTNYNGTEFKEYIRGSAQAVGRMASAVICEKDEQLSKEFSPFVERFTAILQKVNFFRDLNEDFCEMGRSYFPCCNVLSMTPEDRRQIEMDIQEDFNVAFTYIHRIPVKARVCTYVVLKSNPDPFQNNAAQITERDSGEENKTFKIYGVLHSGESQTEIFSAYLVNF